MMWSLINARLKDWKCATSFSLIIYFTLVSLKSWNSKINQLYTLRVICHFNEDKTIIILIVFNYDRSHGSLPQSSVKASKAAVHIFLCQSQNYGFTHQEVIFGVKGDTEDRRFMAPERFLLAAVRHLHHLHHEVAEESRGTENKYVQTGTCAGNLCSHVTDKGNISCEPTQVQIVKSMKKRSKIILISSSIHQNVDATASDAWFLFFFPINITTEIDRMKIAASMSCHALCFYCCDQPVWDKSILAANKTFVSNQD